MQGDTIELKLINQTDVPSALKHQAEGIVVVESVSLSGWLYVCGQILVGTITFFCFITESSNLVDGHS